MIFKMIHRQICIALFMSLMLSSLHANNENNETTNQSNKGENMSVFHIGTLYAKPESIDALIESLAMVSKQKGCISHKVFRDIENPNKIMSYEEWESKEDHDNFVGSFSKEEMGAWIGMLSREPEGAFYTEL
jgi:quinol monooxygenase YgiN